MAALLYFFVFSLPLVFGFPSSNQVNQPSFEVSISPDSAVSSESMAFKCPRNQHWDSCKAHCGRNCTNYNKPVPCPSICISGCICDAGYVWGPDGDCILPSQCRFQGISSSIETDDFCPPNEEFSRCLAHCQRNCSNWSDPTLPCIKICVPGCICKNGMVRGPHGNCLFLRRCPPRDYLGDISGEIECPVNEHFERCSAHCQKNCSNWNQPIPCPEVCIPGCVCDESYVRSATGECIPFEQCSLPEKVSKNEKENAESCPEREHRSRYNILPHSKTLCVHDNDFIDFCPPTYLNGCICDKGLFRGLDSKCIDTRLLPNANELEFMHRNSVETEEDDCDDIIDDQGRRIIGISFPNTESGEQENGDPVAYNQSPLTDSPNRENDLNEGYEILSSINDDGPLTSPPAVSLHQTERDSLPVDGCPDSNICNQQCKSSLHKAGHCIGRYSERCVCYEL